MSHARQHHLAARHASSITIVLLAPTEERPRPETVATKEELRLAIVNWIEKTYHRKRRQRGLGRLTPIEFEILNTTTPKVA